MFTLPTLLGGIGQGIGIVGSILGAKSATATANANYKAQKANAESSQNANLSSLLIEGLSNQLAFDTAQNNFLLAESDAAARTRNAETIRLYAEAQTDAGREGMRRQRASFERFQSTQKAAIGASGVTQSGSALDVMAESVGQMTLALQDSVNQINYNRDSAYNQAALEDFAGQQSLAVARLNLGSASRAFEIGKVANAVGLSSANVSYQSAMASASINRSMGYQNASSQLFNAGAGIFAGIGNIATQQSQTNYLGIR